MIPLSQYVRRGFRSRLVVVEPPKPAPPPRKKSWKERCLEYQIKNAAQPPPTPTEPVKPALRIADIIEAVGHHFNIFPREIESPRRAANVVLPRQAVYYLAKKLT